MKVLILAGGEGRRLRPYTLKIPKPLMHIGNHAILEIIVKQLKSHDLKDLIIATGYLSELIMDFFDDGHKYGLNISYTKEKKPLGTSGPLALIKNDINDTFLVMNGDVLSTIDYNDLISFHKENGGILTIALNKREINIDFGVTKLDEENEIIDYIEKPTIDYLVSMGIYVFEDKIFQYINSDEYLDFPDLVKKLINNGEKVVGYLFEGYWLDIGRHDDYEKAKKDFDDISDSFFVQ